MVTSESLSTAAGASYVLTITDNKIAATDEVLVVISGGTNSAGTPVLMKAVPGLMLRPLGRPVAP